MKSFRIILIGSSAGGLQAIMQILPELSKEYPIPIILVQHRAKEPKDLLEEVLQHKTKLKVKQADEKEKILPGHIYVAPPDYHLLIEQNETFSLSSDEPVQYSRPSIDVLFESAASVYGASLLAIILTGANQDGTQGLKAIKSKNGYTISQNPKEATFQLMPESAIASNTIDKVLNLNEIKQFLINLSNHV
ncbi:CheB methylesterase [Belliella buryatensis]|uniref:protein-glutamate methylesterase n=1 Tax=Belliella buryatensis TaxID=1500549 RepID=A0A239GN26_9BACT|nr:chemotaxis protein CheB [Belliella buryatensis]SNS70158.1 CheB methylesterase [Belliella buryatensis]